MLWSGGPRFFFAVRGEGIPCRSEQKAGARIQHAQQLALMISQPERQSELDDEESGAWVCPGVAAGRVVPVSIVIGVVFGLIWLRGAVFRSFFGK